MCTSRTRTRSRARPASIHSRGSSCLLRFVPTKRVSTLRLEAQSFRGTNDSDVFTDPLASLCCIAEQPVVKMAIVALDETVRDVVREQIFSLGEKLCVAHHSRLRSCRSW